MVREAHREVSVVIPTFDRAELVCRALRSVYQQTLPPDEVLVVDDGSTDDTAARVEREFPQARVIRQDNMGVSAARNRGIEEAQGRWIALLDSDDEWKREKLERQLAQLVSQPHAVCHCDEVWIRNGERVNQRRRHAKRGGRIYMDCLELCAISPSAVVIERSAFAKAGMFDEAFPVCEDYELWLRLTARFPVLLVDQPLVVKYGGHADQLSRSRGGMDRFRVRALAKAWRELDHLSVDERCRTLEVLIGKLEVLIGGARKRDRVDLLRQFEPQVPHFEHLLALERSTA